LDQVETIGRQVKDVKGKRRRIIKIKLIKLIQKVCDETQPVGQPFPSQLKLKS
jgi:hypothetical protein